MKHGSWLVALGVTALAIACGNSEQDPADGEDDDTSEDGGEPNQPTAGRDAGGAGRGGNPGTGGVTNECPNTRCGGDVVGTWEIVESCVGSLMGVNSCPGLTGDSSGLKQAGTVTYNEDSTYSAVVSTTGALALTYPRSCITPTTCDELVRSLESSVESGFSGVSCREEAEACVCEMAVEQLREESGTYGIDGGVLVQQRDGAASPTPVSYCVNADTLTLSAAVSQSYVLERR